MKIKILKLIAYFFTLIISFVFTQEQVSFYFDCLPEVEAGSTGNQMAIILENDVTVAGFQFILNIDPTQSIIITDVENTGLNLSMVNCNYAPDSSYVTIVSFDLRHTIPPQTGPILLLTFDAPAEPQTVAFSISDLLVSDLWGQELDADYSYICHIQITEPQLQSDVSLWLNDLTFDTLEIMVNAETECVTGFEIDFSGITISGTSGGYITEYPAEVEYTYSSIVITGDYCYDDNGILVILLVDTIDSTEVCISDYALHDADGDIIEEVEIGDCLPIPDCSLLGDVNGDGFINILDIISLICHPIGVPPWIHPCDPPCSGDINEDGSTNILDIVQMLSMILEL